MKLQRRLRFVLLEMIGPLRNPHSKSEVVSGGSTWTFTSVPESWQVLDAASKTNTWHSSPREMQWETHSCLDLRMKAFLQGHTLLITYTTCAVLAELGVRPAAERAARASVHSFGVIGHAL